MRCALHGIRDCTICLDIAERSHPDYPASDRCWGCEMPGNPELGSVIYHHDVDGHYHDDCAHAVFESERAMR